MRLFFKLTAIFLFTFALAACQNKPKAPARPIAAMETLRHIDTGDVVGSVTQSAGAYQWAAIPYAEPPIGDLRWRAPRPAKPLNTVHEALDLGVRCVQRARSADIHDELGTLVGTEDCLVLNVWTPPLAQDAAKLPVMVFIHGGSNVWGYGGQYDAQHLATRYNLVVVSINYRLGPFGWLAHPALRETANSEDDKSPNFATLDMIAALQWVQRNITVFGGDAEQVTIFGESAGAHNVASLMAIPRAQGLFHRAIIQSGYFTSHTMERAQNGVPRDSGWDYKGANAVVAALNPPAGLDNKALADFMRSAPAPDIYVAAQEEAETEPGAPLIIADDILLPAISLEAAFDNPSFTVVPFITGTNRDETKLFNIGNEHFVKNFLTILPRPRNAKTYDLQAEYESAMWRARSVDTQARRLGASGGVPVYAYRFDWDEEGSFLGSDFALLLGAGHAMELPFIFDGFDGFPVGNGAIFPKSGAAERDTLSDAMMSYWAAFATNAKPGRGIRGDLPEWRPWQRPDDRLLILDTESDGGIRMSSEQISVGSVLTALRDDQRFTKIVQKCDAFLGVKGWFPEIRAQVEKITDSLCEH